ncbi:AN1 [Linum grandiflorum]
MLILLVAQQAMSIRPTVPGDPIEAAMRLRFEEWMSDFGKEYKDAKEKDMRFTIFKRRVEHIESWNAAVNESTTLGLNQFTDVTDHEFGSSPCVMVPRRMSSRQWKPCLFN